MKASTKNFLLNLYFSFQCITVILTILALFYAIFVYVITLMLMYADIQTSSLNGKAVIIFLIMTLGLLFLLFSAVITPTSAIATINKIRQRPLNKLQKFSYTIFPIIVIPIYICIILLILQSILMLIYLLKNPYISRQSYRRIVFVFLHLRL